MNIWTFEHSLHKFCNRIKKAERDDKHKIYTDELLEIDYNHIPFQSVIMPSEVKVVRLNIEKQGQLIGYIQGAGDEIPTSLRQIGYTVVELKEDEITEDKLANFDAVVLGIRAYNTNDRAKFYQKNLHQYVENGGTLIVQYNTNNFILIYLIIFFFIFFG